MRILRGTLATIALLLRLMNEIRGCNGVQRDNDVLRLPEPAVQYAYTTLRCS